MRERKPIVRRDSAQFAVLCGALLHRGANVRFRAQGRSMTPNILSDDAVIVAPIAPESLHKGDVALTHTKDGFRVHRVSFAGHAACEIITRADAGQEDDASTDAVLGKVIAIERHGRTRSLSFVGQKYLHAFRSLAYQFQQAAALRIRKLASASALLSVTTLFALLLNAAPAAGQTFTLTNSPAPTTVAPGGTITYTQTLASGSKAINPNIVLSQPLPSSTTFPASITFVSMTPTGGAAASFTCSFNSGTSVVSCTDTATYPKNTTTTFTLIVAVNSSTPNGTVVGDTVTVTSGNAPTVSTPAANVTVQTPDLGVSETTSPNPVSDGGNITYSETVTNNSTTAAAVGATLTQSVPANTNFQSLTVPAGWTCPTQPAAGGSGSIVCNATGTFAASGTAIFTVVVQVNTTVAAGTNISNSVTVSETGTDPVSSNNTATSTVAVLIPDLAVTETASPNPVSDGGNITYSETVTNNSATAGAVGATLTQSVPANTNFQSVTVPAGWTCPTQPAVGGTGSIVCNATGTFAASGTAGFTVVVQVNATVSAGTNISNSVTVSETGTDPVSSNNTANSTVAVQVPDLSITDSATPNPVATGSNITYTQVVTNNSATAGAVGATLTETTPSSTNFVSITAPAGWTCGTQPAAGGRGSIVCTANGTFAASATATFTLLVSVSPEATVGSTITNSVSVSETGTDPNSSNNTASASVQVQGADLAMTQSVSAPAVAPGATITYTETVTNNGPNPATGAVLYQQTPPNTTFSSMTPPTGWTCPTLPAVGATGQVICTASAAMNANTTASNFVFVVTVAAGTAAGTVISNYADATSQTTDSNPANNATTSAVLVEVTGDSDMALSMSALPTPVFISSSITYTIQITDRGLASATGVTVVDTLPTTSGGAQALTNVTASTTLGSCTVNATNVSCALGSVAYTPTSPLTVTVTISGTTPATPMTLSNSATVSSTTTDPVASNNTSTVLTVVQPLVCATPGKDGAAGTLTGAVNAYYPPAAAGTVAAGSTSVTLGLAAANGAQTSIAIGDLLLIIQTQAASINSTNTTSYGSGIPGDPSGSTNLNNSGVFEFVTATSAVTANTGGVLTFTGTGANNGLLNSYTYAIATATQGVETFQVIRVPQYSSATLSSGLTAMPWNGATGGVLALDVSSQLTLGGTVALDGLGFRGSGGIDLVGSATGASTDTVTASPATLPALPPPAGSGANGGKGEGIAGTPHWVAPPISSIAHTTTATNTGQAVLEGYPSGSFARGAPGNAGGGATDANPVANDQNSGGGAGGNGGTGGIGGFGWNSAGLVGGYGGTLFPASTSAIIMGGGGGGGTTNNGSYWDPSTDTGGSNCGTSCTGIYSSGGAGGGILIVHAGSVVGTGTISSNGTSALSPENDGAGGGGAGGTVIVFANSGGLTGLTVGANGGSGGNTWPEQGPGTTFPGNRHGAGGGGGGGVIFTTGAPASQSVAGGNPGASTLADDPYGATPGQSGLELNTLNITETPGTQSGAYCAGSDLSVSNSGTPNPVLAGPGPGNVITYTQTVTNNGPFDALNATFSETIPANTTFQSLSFPGGSGWSCAAPSVGGTGTISCSNPDVAKTASTTFTVAVAVNTGVTAGTVITDVVNATSGTNDPNLTNNSATVQTTVAASNTADLAITNSATPNPVVAGNNITYTVVITNNGPSAAGTVAFSEAIPANTTYVSATPNPAAGWTCGVTGGTLTCSSAAMASGASTTFTVVLNVASNTAAGTTITDTAQVFSTTSDPNPNNNSATVNVTVATATQSDLSVTSTASTNVITDGNNITYTQVVTNNGPAASGLATFTDTVPAGATFVSMSVPSGWACGTLPAVGSTGGAITCTIPSLAVNATASFPLVLQAALGDTPGTTISNTANINVPCSSTTDPNCSNNSATTSVLVASPSQADVTIAKTASPDPVDQGTTLTYSITVTNNGPAIATGVTVNDPIPAQVTYVSYSTSNGTTCTYTSATATLNCPLGSISVGGNVLITITVTANTFSSTTLSTNTATLTTTTSNPNPNTSASFTSTIAAPTAVQLALFRAIPRQGGGVLLEWKTREEVRNLGFHIFRLDGGTRRRINPSIIAGSALLIRGGRPQHAAKTYQWFDPSGTAQSLYELEDVDLNGARVPHGPISVDVSAAPSAGGIAQPLLVTQLSQAIARPVKSAPHLLQVPHPVIPVPPPSENPVSLDGDTAVKISVQSEGWYQVTQPQLVAAGLDPNADAHFLQLFAEGIEQPILVLGKQSGPLGPNDSIQFYGTGIDTPFSGTRVYWLIEGKHPGKRIRTITPAASGLSQPASFPFTALLEERTTYFATLLNGENNDNFFGDAVTSAPVDENLTVAHADASSSIPVSVDITLQGATDQQAHSVSVAFNGANLGEMDFANFSNYTQTFQIDRSLLQDGVNTVELTALNGDNDVSVVQSVALHYPHTYEADANWLKATANSGETLHVSGFSSQQIQALDITDPLNILQLDGTIQQDGSAFGITFGAPRSAETLRTLLIFSSDQIAQPSGFAFHQPGGLASQKTGSQMLIITHPDFAAALPPLVQFHQSQGMSVQVVSIDEIFDAFNYGERSPLATQAFLQNAVSNWSSKPQYLLLVGGASLDPRNYLGLGDFDFVPTRIIETVAFKTASDDWFSDFTQTGFPTIATGRIPARTLSDAQLVVSKILSYANSGGSSSPQALLVADQNVGADFTTATKNVASDLPASLLPVEVFADGQDPSVVSQQILAALNGGPLLVNYSGHGAEQQWSFEDLLDTNSTAALSNSSQYSIYLLMDCLNGFFHDVYAESLSTSLLLAPNGGAAAVWASSGFTNQPPQASMNQALLQAIKANPSLSLGSAIILAKSGVTDPDVRRTWIFFGDPAMRLQPSVTAAGHTASSPIPSDPRPSGPRAPHRPGNPPITKTPY